MCSAAGHNEGGNCDAIPENLAKIEGIITLAVAETNRAFELSGVATKLRLVKTHFDASFNDYTNSWEDTLTYLHDNGDGELDYVHAMRDQYGADFVSMLVDSPEYCGIGYQPSTPTAGDAFSLTQWSCATGYYSFAHELGHNMGCSHDIRNAGDSGGSNYGYQDTKSMFRSILAYDCKSKSCPRIQYFSSPKLRYNGRTVGSTRANNVAQINNNLSAFANFRESVATIPSPTTSPPVAPPTPAPTQSITVLVPTPAPTQSVTAVPVPVPSTSLSLTAPLSGGKVGAEGNMFDIKATKNLFVSNFAVHASAASTVTVEVYKKKTTGKFSGTESTPSKWVKLGEATFRSNGEGIPTVLPEGTFPPVFVMAGAVQAFYITFTEATNLNRYSQGSTYGSVLASNADLQIRHGIAKQYLFRTTFEKRAWNGIVYYRMEAKASDTVRSIPTSSAMTTTASDVVADKLKTTFAGGIGQDGNMIEVLAFEDIVVNSFDVHTSSTGNVHAFVYVKKGTFVGFEREPSAWRNIADISIVGQGSHNATPIPEKDVIPVTINAGETYSFYITSDDKSIRYTSGQVMAEDPSLKILRSSGNKFPFGASFQDRIWNGVIHYVPADSATD